MEPGSKKPTAPYEACWTIICPVVYCGANPGNPCMNKRGRFSLKTHVLRRNYYETAQSEGKIGWGPANRQRPKTEMGLRSDYMKNPEFFQAVDGLEGHVTNKYYDSLFVDDEDFDPFWDLEDDFFDECQ